jgi:hypothetical protein
LRVAIFTFDPHLQRFTLQRCTTLVLVPAKQYARVASASALDSHCVRVQITGFNAQGVQQLCGECKQPVLTKANSGTLQCACKVYRPQTRQTAFASWQTWLTCAACVCMCVCIRSVCSTQSASRDRGEKPAAQTAGQPSGVARAELGCGWPPRPGHSAARVLPAVRALCGLCARGCARLACSQVVSQLPRERQDSGQLQAPDQSQADSRRSRRRRQQGRAHAAAQQQEAQKGFVWLQLVVAQALCSRKLCCHSFLFSLSRASRR